MKTYYIGITVVIIIIIVLACYDVLFQQDKRKQRIEALYLNGKFAIGTIKYKGYNTYDHAITLMDIGYWFDFQNNTHRGSISRGIAKIISKETYTIFLKSAGRRAGAAVDAQFLVLYGENDLENSIILFECPINSETDFARYVAEIEELRKDPKWRGYK